MRLRKKKTSLKYRSSKILIHFLEGEGKYYKLSPTITSEQEIDSAASPESAPIIIRMIPFFLFFFLLKNIEEKKVFFLFF